MRRRSDVIEALLEEWAGWRLIYRNLDIGYGDCTIAHFREPGGTAGRGSTPLWYGRRTGRQLLALNHDLDDDFNQTCIAILLTLYGMPGPLYKKASAMEITVEQLQKLKRRARVIALRHIPKTLTAKVFHRDRYRNRSEESVNIARPQRSVFKPDKSGT